MGNSNKCNHLDPTYKFSCVWTREVPSLGLYQSTCTRCAKSGPKGKSFTNALKNFWTETLTDQLTDAGFKPEYIPGLIRGEDMYVPGNPHEAYKMGVEDAIREIQENMPLPRTKDPIDVLNAIPHFVRKKLLTESTCTIKEADLSTEDYKRGVLEATKELIEGTLPSSKLFKVAFDEEMQLRRKKLLTKKVTKWINIWETGPSVFDPACVRFGTGVLYDDKSTAEANVIDPTRQGFLGTYPIEIETEI